LKLHFTNITYLLQSVFLLGTLAAHSQKLDSSHHVPVEKQLSAEWKNSLWSNERKVYKGDELTTIAMPCGGIAAGQLYVTGDGTLANWWISNNAYNTGYGIDWLLNFNTPQGPWKVCYQTIKPFKYIDQGFQVTVKQNGKEYRKELSGKDFDDISFIGEYPVAKINYSSKSAPLPVKIDATVYSPFIPLNARESATPATILNYRFENTGNEETTINITGWLQNLVCLDLKQEATGKSRNRVISGNGMRSIMMDLTDDKSYTPSVRKITVIEDFESGNFNFWKVEGTAFGKIPVKDSARGQQQDVSGYEGKHLINSFSSAGEDTAVGKLTSKAFKIADDFITFKIGGGGYKDGTCLNLLVNGKLVRTASGENLEKLTIKTWDVKEFKGKKAILEIIDNEKGSWGHINLDQIAFSNVPGKDKYFPAGHPYFGNISLSVLGNQTFADADYIKGTKTAEELSAEKTVGEKLLGATGTTIVLKPGESKEVTFLLSWFFPNRPQQYGEGGNWNQAIPTDGPAIGNMYANWFSNSVDVAEWLSENYARLSAQTFAFHDSYYNNSSLPYWLVQRLMMPVSTLATETCQWWATDKFWAWEGVGSCVGTCTHVWNYEQALSQLFPELERNIREKTDFATSFQENGSILSRNGWGGVLIDGHAGAILKAYRENLYSKDGLFLSRNWEKIKRATNFIIGEDGNEDGIIEKEQANTYDIAFYGPNTYVGSLYLSALKAASKMALIMNDPVFSKKCDSIFENGKNYSVNKLWNGEYFTQEVDRIKHPQFQYGTGCLSDQVFGQTWAHLYGLGYIYPEQNVKKALQSIWKYNWAPQVGIQTKIHAPERTYADFEEPGLLVATWPFEKHPGENGVRYRDEVWTGIEYQVATNMIYEGMVDEGLSIIKSIHERYSPEKHNPWNEIECGDHYARALASWGVLDALQGYQYNGPEKTMTIDPVKKEEFAGFFTAAEGWGNFKREIKNNVQNDEISIKYGKLQLIKLSLPASADAKNIKITFDGKDVPVKVDRSNGLVTLSFDELSVRENKPLLIVSN
jgi:non-lysosomal glucosylceramidase